MLRRVSSQIDPLLFEIRRTFRNLQQTCTEALFCTSSMSAEAVGARAGSPIKVSLTDSAGRGVFTTRNIGSGELIHTAKPLVTHPSLALSDQVCCYCLKKLDKDGSSGIFSSLKGEDGTSYCFCSEECRDVSKACCEVESKADWSLYHDHCRAKGLKYPLMVKRFACMVISGAASADDLGILQPARLLPGAVSQMEEEFELLKRTLLKAQIDERLTGFLTKQWYMGVLARIRINAFRIELVAASYKDLLESATASVAAQAAVGNALYMLPSFYNHDCDPNTHIVWIDSAFAKLKALRHIEEGEELRICYLDASLDCAARQKLLSEGFGFHCRCFRCLSHD
ncbi:histone-lysine N-methyltransferase ATXR4 [Dendrobium catenatum]|uniref:histone-lysine N-methyltransferase ATXR4 n=1 Tax=Dendrobium catenatum TaxID=906689 RepID=UPI0010A030FA|nr:histone-lysine N-methyltransferase ATXR4 [Dendrobium catenatum]